jgi:hypothetical protein
MSNDIEQLRAAILELNAAREVGDSIHSAYRGAIDRCHLAERACRDLGISTDRPDPDPILAMFPSAVSDETPSPEPPVDAAEPAAISSDRRLAALVVDVDELEAALAPLHVDVVMRIFMALGVGSADRLHFHVRPDLNYLSCRALHDREVEYLVRRFGSI